MSNIFIIVWMGIIVLSCVAMFLVQTTEARNRRKEQEYFDNRVNDIFTLPPTRAKEPTHNNYYLFKHGELKTLVLKYIKTRKGITMSELRGLIPYAKPNSLKVCVQRLKRDGIIKSVTIPKVRYSKYVMKELDID